jgi:hypothetical protein
MSDLEKRLIRNLTDALEALRKIANETNENGYDPPYSFARKIARAALNTQTGGGDE